MLLHYVIFLLNKGILQAIGSVNAAENQEFNARQRYVITDFPSCALSVRSGVCICRLFILRAFQANIQEIQKMQQLMELWLESFDNFCNTNTMLVEAWDEFHSKSPYQGNFSRIVLDHSSWKEIIKWWIRFLQSLMHRLIQPSPTNYKIPWRRFKTTYNLLYITRFQLVFCTRLLPF